MVVMIVDGGRMMMKTDQGKGKDGGFGLRRRKTGRGWVDTERRERRGKQGKFLQKKRNNFVGKKMAHLSLFYTRKMATKYEKNNLNL